MKFSDKDVHEFLSAYYNIVPDRIKMLNSYDDINYKIEVAERTYLLKLSEDASIGFIKTQNAFLKHLSDRNFQVPDIIPAVEGQDNITLYDGKYVVRLLSFLEGTFLSSLMSNLDIPSLGYFLGRLDYASSTYHDIHFGNVRNIWNMEYTPDVRSYLHYITDPALRTLVHYFIQQFEVFVVPMIKELPHGLIHNDPNPDNILISKNDEYSIIDFGDMIYGPMIFNPAICLTYILLESEDICADASKFMKAYRSQHHIDNEHLQILYYLITARISASICSSSAKIHNDPDNVYASKDQPRMIRLLKALHKINPTHFITQVKGSTKLSQTGDLLDKRTTSFSTSMSLSYNIPIHMEKASLQYMYDTSGNAYLDCVNNIMHVGHNHPVVTDAAIRQISSLNTNTRYLYDNLYRYAEKLLSTFPSSLSKVFFVNSGSAAADLAIRMAYTSTHSPKLAVMDQGYHGNTRSSIAASPYKFNGKGGDGKQTDVHIFDMPQTEGPLAPSFINAQLDAFDRFASGDKVSCMMEAILGCGGQFTLQHDYVQHIRKAVQSSGGVFIADEVQIGFGRMGSHFWGFEIHDIVPDIVILGKPIANGHPVGAVICTEEVCRNFETGMEFFSSFGGNPVSCSLAEAVLDIVVEQEMQQHAFEVGNYLLANWRHLATQSSWIGEARGRGLFLGLSIIDPHTQNPDGEKASELVNRLKDEFHILLSTDGPHHNIIKFKPSMIFDKSNADYLSSALEKVIKGA